MSEHTFDSKKIFFILFVATMVEVAWGLTFEGSSRWLLWSGLLICAYYKGLLIFQYFMHMKFEGWIVKCLIAPTLPLIAIILLALSPDVSNNDLLLYEIGTQLDEDSGEIVEIWSPEQAEQEHGVGH